MAEAAKALATGQIIEFGGLIYRLKPFDLDMASMFEVWLENEAWKAVERHRGRIPDEVYQGRLDAVSRLVAAQAFAYGGELAARSALTMKGQSYVLFLMLLGGGNEDVSERLAHDMMQQAYAEIQARMREANYDPNSPSPKTEPADA